MSHEDDVRPFFGELPEVLGDERMPWVPDTERYATMAQRQDERRALRIADGMCPWECSGTLDESGYCSCCGKEARAALPEPEPAANVFLNELPTPRPRELTDCFAPANIDDEAA